MTSRVLLVAIFLVCGAVSQDIKPATKNLTSTNAEVKSSVPQKTEVKGDAAVPPKSSVESVDNIDNSNVKSTTPKTKSDVKVYNQSDVPSMIGDSAMFSRAAYLLTGISVLVLLYFAYKSFRLRRRPTHIHKYGVVASREDLEMTSLGFGSEDEDDDTTHFDIGKHQRS